MGEWAWERMAVILDVLVNNGAMSRCTIWRAMQVWESIFWEDCPLRKRRQLVVVAVSKEVNGEKKTQLIGSGGLVTSSRHLQSHSPPPPSLDERSHGGFYFFARDIQCTSHSALLVAEANAAHCPVDILRCR
jgi:hypothetical protein